MAQFTWMGFGSVGQMGEGSEIDAGHEDRRRREGIRKRVDKGQEDRGFRSQRGARGVQSSGSTLVTFYEDQPAKCHPSPL